MRLSDKDIKLLLEEGNLIIDPQPTNDKITGVTVDLTLSSMFKTFNNIQVPFIDLSEDRDSINLSISRLTGEVIVIENKDLFFIHPGELVIGMIEENISIPENLVGILDGRSSLARLGLCVHISASRIDPGWNGRIALEFYNCGKVPLGLRPGMDICAISFELITSYVDVSYKNKSISKYINQTQPDITGINKG